MTARKWAIFAAALLLMGAGVGLLLRFQGGHRLGPPGVRTHTMAGTSRLRVELPARVGAWVSTNVEPAEMELKMLPQDTSFGKRLYRAPDGFQTLATVVIMGTDRTSIHKPEYCLEMQGWRISRRDAATVPMRRPHAYELPVRKFTAAQIAVAPGGRVQRWSGVYAFWFVDGSRVTTSHLARMGWITWDLLRHGVLPRWAYVSFFATCPPGQEEATFGRLRQFIADAVPEFQLVALPSGARP